MYNIEGNILAMNVRIYGKGSCCISSTLNCWSICNTKRGFIFSDLVPTSQKTCFQLSISPMHKLPDAISIYGRNKDSRVNKYQKQ